MDRRKRIALYGGTFDPVHLGHIEVAKRVTQLFEIDQLFKGELGESADLFFVMGADSWAEITSWREWKRLLTMVNHIVVTRPGYALDAQPMTPWLAERIVELRSETAERIADRLQSAEGPQIFLTDAVMIDISATDIRRAVRANTDELTQLVPPTVADYIRKYQLYEDSNET